VLRRAHNYSVSSRLGTRKSIRESITVTLVSAAIKISGHFSLRLLALPDALSACGRCYGDARAEEGWRGGERGEGRGGRGRLGGEGDLEQRAPLRVSCIIRRIYRGMLVDRCVSGRNPCLLARLPLPLPPSAVPRLRADGALAGIPSLSPPVSPPLLPLSHRATDFLSDPEKNL